MKNMNLKMFLLAIILFAGYTTYRATQTNSKLADSMLANIETLAGENDDTIDGGELEGGGITCDRGGSGKCYKVSYWEGLYGVCYFYCQVTGDPDNYCSSFYVNFVNFCTAVGGIV